MHWKKELRAAELGRALDAPGDAFFELKLTNQRLDEMITVRTWVEVSEIFLPGQAAKVNRFIREYNGLRGKGAIDGSEFLRSLDLGPPGIRIQRDMADEVVAAVKRKARKGDTGGSYRLLVDDYGRGVLIIGLPLWFAAWPATIAETATLLEEFVPRVLLGFQAIERSGASSVLVPLRLGSRDLEPHAEVSRRVGQGGGPLFLFGSRKRVMALACFSFEGGLVVGFCQGGCKFHCAVGLASIG